MQLNRALEDTETLAKELLLLVDLPLCNGSDRVVIADVACSLAFEYWHSLRLLLRARLLSAVLVLHRSQFEAVLRSVWLTYAATDAEVTRLSAPLNFESEQAAKNIAQAQDMMERLAKSGPGEAHAALLRFKENSWKALNSFAHAGIHPLSRHAEGYPEQLMHSVLCNANGMAVLAAMQAVVLRGAQPLQREVLQLATRHSACMPPPL